VLWVIAALNNYFTQSIVHVHILASLTHKVLKKLSKQTKPIPETRKGKHYKPDDGSNRGRSSIDNNCSTSSHIPPPVAQLEAESGQRESGP